MTMFQILDLPGKYVNKNSVFLWLILNDSYDECIFFLHTDFEQTLSGLNWSSVFSWFDRLNFLGMLGMKGFQPTLFWPNYLHRLFAYAKSEPTQVWETPRPLPMTYLTQISKTHCFVFRLLQEQWWISKCYLWSQGQKIRLEAIRKTN